MNHEELEKLERRLKLLNDRYLTTDDYWADRKEAVELERTIARAKGLPHLISADFPIPWCTGDPTPYLLKGEHDAFLTFGANQPDPEWDGSYIREIDPASLEAGLFCLVRFKWCSSARLGFPNDEVQHGHLANGAGLEGYEAQILVDSPWVAELEKIESVHDYYKPGWFANMNHYIFWFHDSTFECVAESFEWELYECSLRELLRLVADKLLDE